MENKNKKGDIEKTILLQLILVALVMIMFIFSTAKKVEGRGVRQDIIEAQVAMAIGAGVPGMSFEVFKINANGLISSMKVEGGKVFISMDGLGFTDGHSYFSRYDVEVIDDKNKFLVIIK